MFNFSIFFYLLSDFFEEDLSGTRTLPKRTPTLIVLLALEDLVSPHAPAPQCLSAFFVQNFTKLLNAPNWRIQRIYVCVLVTFGCSENADCGVLSTRKQNEKKLDDSPNVSRLSKCNILVNPLPRIEQSQHISPLLSTPPQKISLKNLAQGVQYLLHWLAVFTLKWVLLQSELPYIEMQRRHRHFSLQSIFL